MIRFFDFGESVVRDLQPLCEASLDEDVLDLKFSGKGRVLPVKGYFDRYGYVMCRGCSARSAEERTERVLDRLRRIVSQCEACSA